MNRTRYQNIVNEYVDMVYRIALNQMQNPHDADDVLQNVFIKLYTKGSDDLAGEHLKRWLIRVTVNECKSIWRHPWRRRVDLQEVKEDQAVLEDRPYEELYEAVAALPEACRIVVHLFYFEGYRTAEIAEILHMKEPTVRTRLSRARQQLKETLKEACEDDSDRL